MDTEIREQNLVINNNATVQELIQRIKGRKGNNIEVYLNGQKLEFNDTRTLLQCQINNDAKLDVRVQQVQQDTDSALLKTGYYNGADITNTNLESYQNCITTKPNNIITLTCVNNAESGLDNKNIVLDNIQIAGDQTVSELKNKILMTTCHGVDNQGAKFTYTLQTDNIKAGDFVVCTVSPAGEPIKILYDNTPISAAFNNNNANYVIVSKTMCFPIMTNNNERFDIIYPAIIEENNQVRFNKEPLRYVINKMLSKENKTIKETSAMWDGQNGLELVKGFPHGGFVASDPINITTKTITAPPVPVRTATAQQITTTTIGKNYGDGTPRSNATPFIGPNTGGLVYDPQTQTLRAPAVPVQPPFVPVPAVPVQQSGDNRPKTKHSL